MDSNKQRKFFFILSLLSMAIIIVNITFINFFVFPITFVPYLVTNLITYPAKKIENQKAKEKILAEANRKQESYQTLINTGYVVKPNYLPSYIGEPIEEKPLEFDFPIQIGASIDYTCNRTPRSLLIEYFPIATGKAQSLRVSNTLSDYENKPIFNALRREGDMTFERTFVNGKPAYYETFSRSYRPYTKLLGWETKYVVINMRVYSDCSLSKEEIIRIGESMR